MRAMWISMKYFKTKIVCNKSQVYNGAPYVFNSFAGCLSIALPDSNCVMIGRIRHFNLSKESKLLVYCTYHVSHKESSAPHNLINTPPKHTPTQPAHFPHMPLSTHPVPLSVTNLSILYICTCDTKVVGKILFPEICSSW